jgi:hypothetical protein
MKKQFLIPVIFFCLFLLPFSCDLDSDPYLYNEPTIYSESNKTLFSEIVFFIKPYILDAGQKKYIVSDTLKNISLKINDVIERKSDSFPLDVAHLYSKAVFGNYLVTEQLIHYPIVTKVTKIPEKMVTAGQYADLLNDYLNLQPGTYVCQIVSFDIKTNTGGLKTVYTPELSLLLTVKENVLSVDLGEFEVEVK